MPAGLSLPLTASMNTEAICAGRQLRHSTGTFAPLNWDPSIWSNPLGDFLSCVNQASLSGMFSKFSVQISLQVGLRNQIAASRSSLQWG